MLKPSRRADLALESLDGIGSQQIRWQRLDDDVSPELAVRRKEYMRHAATAKLALERVRGGERARQSLKNGLAQAGGEGMPESRSGVCLALGDCLRLSEEAE